MEMIVRIIKTFHVTVNAEFGDAPETLLAKGVDALKKTAEPDNVSAVLMPETAVL